MNINDDESQSSYISDLDEQEKESSVHSAMDDLILNKYNNSKSEKRKNVDENNLYNDGRPRKIKSIEKNALQHNDISSNTSTGNSINKNHTTRSNTCHYKVSSTTMFHCPNQATCKCSHCSISFCFQHSLQHQQDLKEELQSLLRKTQELFNNVEKLNFISIKSSLMAQLDKWAATMHEKTEQRRNVLHLTLDQFEKKIEEKQDDMKIHLENDLQENVGCVLKKQLEQFEMNKQQVEKASRKLNLLENFVHSLNNQQLITINIHPENQMILNPPTILCPDIIVDGLNLKENSPEKIDSSDQQTNEICDNLFGDISSLSNLTADASEGFPNTVLSSKDIHTITIDDCNTTEVVEKTDTQIQQCPPVVCTNIFSDLFAEDMFNSSINNEILVEGVVSSVNNSQENKLTIKWYCPQCEVTIGDRCTYCKNCKSSLHWTCLASGKSGTSKNYSRHFKRCNYCGEFEQNRQLQKRAGKVSSLGILIAEQRPWSEWSRSNDSCIHYTGFDIEQIQQLYSFCEPTFINYYKYSTRQQPRKKSIGLSPMNMLSITLWFLKHYCTEHHVGTVIPYNKTTGRRLISATVDILHDCAYPKLVVLPDSMDDNKTTTCEPKQHHKLLVQSFLIPANRPIDFKKDEAFYNEKSLTGYAFKVQIACDFHHRIVHASKCYPGSTPGITILRESGLLEHIQDVEKIITDKEYIGEQYMVTLGKKLRGNELITDEQNSNRSICAAKIAMENVKQRIKNYAVLGSIYRGLHDDFDKITKIVHVVCALCNFQLSKHAIRNPRP